MTEKEQTYLITIICGFISCFLGLTVMYGWYIQSISIVQIYPDFAPMQFNTAICFFFSGLSIITLACKHDMIAFIASGAVVMFTFFTLQQYIFDIDFGIDQIFIEPFTGVHTSHLGRMAPNTALCFFLSGLTVLTGVIAPMNKRTSLVIEVLAFIILGLSFLAFWGYIQDVERAYSWADFTRMAMHTSIGFIVIGIGLVGYIWRYSKVEIASVPLWVPFLLFLCALNFDLYTTLDIASGTAYVPLIFCSLWFKRTDAPFILAVLTSTLVVIGYFASQGPDMEIIPSFINRALSIGAIWITAIIIYLHIRKDIALRDNDAQMKAIVENALDGIIAINEKGAIESFNSASEKIFGYSKEEVIGKNIKMLMARPHKNNHDSYLAKYKETGKTNILGVPRELEAVRKCGETFPIELSTNSVTLMNKTLFIGIIRDITERKNIERQLIQSQKLDAIGQLSGGIAHDFNNLLTIIFGNTRALLKDMKENRNGPPSHIKKVENIRATAQRGADLVKHLMMFSNQDIRSPVVTNANDMVRDISNLLQTSLGETIKIETELEDNLWFIDVDPTLLEHVLINMGVNAKDAMPDGGTLSIKTSNLYFNNNHASTTLKCGAYVLIKITDTGTGIDEDIIDHIFEPFYTTKPTGQGTGLGLSMVHDFIKKSGGSIHVESTKNEGASFYIYLPKSKNAYTHKIADTSEDKTKSYGSETLLLVEDESEIQGLSVDFLQEYGYTVITARNGEEAIDIFINNIDRIDLLFTDIVMPGDINGAQLAARALALKPELKLLFTTGYAKENIPDYDLIRRFPVIDKPYKSDDILSKIRETIDS